MPLPSKSATISQASTASNSSSGRSTGSMPTSPSPSITSDIALSPRIFSVSSVKTISDVLQYITVHLEDEKGEAVPECTIFIDIPYKWGPHICKQLDKEDGKVLGSKYRITWNSQQRTLAFSMPTLIHEAVALWYSSMTDIWLINGIITLREKKEIRHRTNTTFTLPASPYEQSSKIPDVAVRPNDALSLPSLVIEVRWTEPMIALETDIELLLRGSEREIQKGITIKWYQQNTTVRGFASVWGLDKYDRLIKEQQETIFPKPQNGSTALRLTRGELWRGSLEANRDPHEVFNLNLDILRDEAAGALCEMGLTPATC